MKKIDNWMLNIIKKNSKGSIESIIVKEPIIKITFKVAPKKFTTEYFLKNAQGALTPLLECDSLGSLAKKYRWLQIIQNQFSPTLTLTQIDGLINLTNNCCDQKKFMLEDKNGTLCTNYNVRSNSVHLTESMTPCINTNKIHWKFINYLISHAPNLRIIHNLLLSNPKIPIEKKYLTKVSTILSQYENSYQTKKGENPPKKNNKS